MAKNTNLKLNSEAFVRIWSDRNRCVEGEHVGMRTRAVVVGKQHPLVSATGG